MGNKPSGGGGRGRGGRGMGSRRPSLHDNLVKDTKSKIEDTYNVVEQALASGTSTQIKKASLKKYTKSERTSGVAIKLYDGKAQIPPDLKKEAEILGQCDHPNIIKLYEVSKIGKRMSLVLELCNGGRLLERMPYSEAQASHIVRQLCSAVAYLHSHNIVHRDIECSNILYATTAEDSDIKLIDFGCATELEMVPGHRGAFKFLKEKTGSLHVMAPEVIKERYGPKADVWSIGIVAYMVLTNGQQPFTGQSVQDIERKIIQGSIDYRGWQHSESSKQFIQETAMVNAGLRMSAATALKHPWVEKTIASWKLPQELVVSFDLFQMAPPLKRIALNALAKKAPESKYRSLFRDLDTTESGTLTKDEFMEGFKHSGNSKEELQDLFDKLDVNCNGEIMFTEFLAATLEAEGELEEAQLQEAFDLLSRKTKYITRKDISRIVGQMKNSERSKLREEVSTIFKTKDKYDYEDFAQLFEHGFDASRNMDVIIETSLNEEQLSKLQEDDYELHMSTIREMNDS